MPWWGWTLAGVSIFSGVYACWAMRSAGDDAELFDRVGTGRVVDIDDPHAMRRIFPEV